MIKQILVLLSGILASFSIFGSDWNIVYQTDQMTDEKKFYTLAQTEAYLYSAHLIMRVFLF